MTDAQLSELRSLLRQGIANGEAEQAALQALRFVEEIWKRRDFYKGHRGSRGQKGVPQGQRRCYLCGQIKVLSEFVMCRTGNPAACDGYLYQCKSCKREESRLRRWKERRSAGVVVARKVALEAGLEPVAWPNSGLVGDQE